MSAVMDRDLTAAREQLSAAFKLLDEAAVNLPDLEAHAARELRADIAESLRRLSNLMVFAERTP